MCDPGRRREQDPAAARAQRRAEVDVLFIHEVPLVEQARFKGRVAAGEEAGAAHPVHLALARDQSIDIAPCARGSAGRPAHPPPLRQLGQRREHRPVGDLGPAVGVDEARTGGRGPRREQPIHEPVDRTRRDDRVAVQEKHQRRRRLPEADVVGGRKPGVPVERHQLDGGPAGAHGLYRAVRGCVVDDDDLPQVARPVRRERGQASLEIAPGVETDDDDVQGGRRHSAATRCGAAKAISRLGVTVRSIVGRVPLDCPRYSDALRVHVDRSF